jgi:hypothetical protein
VTCADRRRAHGKPATERWRSTKAVECDGESFRCGGRHEESADSVVDDLVDAADPRRDRREPRDERFE